MMGDTYRLKDNGPGPDVTSQALSGRDYYTRSRRVDWESQRDSVFQPRVARLCELPWVQVAQSSIPSLPQRGCVHYPWLPHLPVDGIVAWQGPAMKADVTPLG